MPASVRSPREKTVRQLFAASINRCAFPGCSTTIFDIKANVLVGEICHIHAANVGGPRYDSGQTDEERHGYGNLILMCATHHKIIDAPEKLAEYTADNLRAIKRSHEASASVGLAKDQALLELAVLAIKRLQTFEDRGISLDGAQLENDRSGFHGGIQADGEAGFLDKLNDAELGMESIGNISHAVNAISEELSRILKRASEKTRAISAIQFSTATKLVVANQMAVQFQSPADRLQALACEYADAVDRTEPGIIYLFQRMATNKADYIAGQDFVHVFDALTKTAGDFSFKLRLSEAMMTPLLNISRSFKNPVNSMTTSFTVLENANKRFAGWQSYIQGLREPPA